MPDAALTGQPSPFQFEGLLYHLAPLTARLKGGFCYWVGQEAYLGVQRYRATYTAEDYERQLKGLRLDGAAHEYDWGTETCHKALLSDDGVQYMAWLLMKAGEPSGGAFAPRPEPARPGPPGPAPPKAPELTVLDRVREDAAKWAELADLVMGAVFPNRPRPEGEPSPAPSGSTPPASSAAPPGG